MGVHQNGNGSRIYALKGDLPKAEETLLTASSILVDTFGANHPDVATWRTELGNILVAGEHPKDAVYELERANAVWQKRPKLHARRGDTEFALAKAQWAAGQMEAAFDSAKRALSAYDHAGPAYSKSQAAVDAWLNDQE